MDKIFYTESKLTNVLQFDDIIEEFAQPTSKKKIVIKLFNNIYLYHYLFLFFN